MAPYRVFIASDVIATLRTRRGWEKRHITRLFDQLAGDPYRKGDYVEPDDVGRPIEVIIIGRSAVCYWADHAVKEVKIIDIRLAGR